MIIFNQLRALTLDSRQRLIRWVLGHRIRARHPTLICDPTAIWDYGYNDIDAIEIGEQVAVAAFTEIIVYKQSPYSAVPGRLILANRSVLATGVNVRAAGGTIQIGEGSVLSQHTVAVAANHQITGQAAYLHSKWDETRTGVTVGKNVWVGANCVLLPGTMIGDDAVIAAGSVVRGTIPPGELWGGVPASKIRVL